eukprot:gene8469-11451_t
MSIAEAVQFKELGNAAYSAGNFNVAIQHFTDSIKAMDNLSEEIHKELQKIVYSNRSAAYLKLNKLDEALSDANRCINIDGNWVKGYSRKGDALLRKKLFTDAHNAYNNGLRIATNDPIMKEKCEQAMRAIRNSSEQQSRTTNSSSNDSTLVIYIKASIIISAILYFITIPVSASISKICYRYSAVSSILIGLFTLYKNYGFPKFTMEYAQSIVTDSVTMNVFLGSFIVFSSPYILALFPLILASLSSLVPAILTQIRNNLPELQSRIEPMLAQYIPSLRGQDLSQFFSSQRASSITFAMAKVSAQCEVYQGLYLIFELITPKRNLILLCFWWQYLQMRYMIDQSGNLKAAFASLDARISSILSHRLCPVIVRTGYSMIKSAMAKQVQIPKADGSNAGTRGGIGSMLSKCIIS